MASLDRDRRRIGAELERAIRTLVGDVAAWSGLDSDELLERKSYVEPLRWLKQVAESGLT